MATTWFNHIYFITSIHSTYTQYVTGGLGWNQKLIRTLSKMATTYPEHKVHIHDLLIPNQYMTC